MVKRRARKCGPAGMESRVADVRKCYQQLEEIGLHVEVCPGLKLFKIVANDFVRDGRPRSGRVELPEVSRAIVYDFREGGKSVVMLRARPS